MEHLRCNLTFRHESVEGIALDALKSGLQKYIRLGKVVKAIKCATYIHRLFIGPVVSRTKSLCTNLMNRLLVIALEDCGPAIASDLILKIHLQMVHLLHTHTHTLIIDCRIQ